jgi:hypothetical protein
MSQKPIDKASPFPEGTLRAGDTPKIKHPGLHVITFIFVYCFSCLCLSLICFLLANR